MYTLFHLSHTTGSTVMRALSWEFPNDPSLAAIDHQFLLGPSLMITPVLGQGMTSRGGIFPGVGDGEKWYDWYTQEVVNAQPGVNLTIDAPLGHIPVYIRGGAVLPQQEALYTTAESRNSSWSLIAALDANGAATGQLYVDDGESIEPETDLFVDFTVSESSLYASGRGLYPDTNKLANITILGVQSAPSKVTLNGASIEGSAQVDYNSTSQVVCIKGLESLTEDGAWAKDWTLTWA
jgi:alpha-glucosidase